MDKQRIGYMIGSVYIGVLDMGSEEKGDDIPGVLVSPCMLLGLGNIHYWACG
jgi:hypothetical protein